MLEKSTWNDVYKESAEKMSNDSNTESRKLSDYMRIVQIKVEVEEQILIQETQASSPTVAKFAGLFRPFTTLGSMCDLAGSKNDTDYSLIVTDRQAV